MCGATLLFQFMPIQLPPSSSPSYDVHGKAALYRSTYDHQFLDNMPASRAVDDLFQDHLSSEDKLAISSLWQPKLVDSAKLLSLAATKGFGSARDKKEGSFTWPNSSHHSKNSKRSKANAGFDFPVIEWSDFVSEAEEEESHDLGYTVNATMNGEQNKPSHHHHASLVRSLSLLSDIMNDEHQIDDNKNANTTTVRTGTKTGVRCRKNHAKPLLASTKRRRLSEPGSDYACETLRLMVLSPHGSASEGVLDLAGRLEGTNKFFL